MASTKNEIITEIKEIEKRKAEIIDEVNRIEERKAEIIEEVNRNKDEFGIDARQRVVGINLKDEDSVELIIVKE
jgi:hypothetical protein